MGRKILFVLVALAVPGGLIALALVWLEQRFALRRHVLSLWRALVALLRRNAERGVDEEEQGVQRIGRGSRPPLRATGGLAKA